MTERTRSIFMVATLVAVLLTLAMTWHTSTLVTTFSQRLDALATQVAANSARIDRLESMIHE